MSFSRQPSRLCTFRQVGHPGDGRHLVTEEGRPFFWLADTAWALTTLKQGEVTEYFRKRVAQGFTVIQGPVLLAHRGHACGLQPLATANPGDLSMAAAWDKDRPCEAYFKHIDFLLDQASEQGLYLAPVVVWGDICRQLFKPEEVGRARRLGHWLGERFAGWTNLVWVVCGEYQLAGAAYIPVLRGLAEGLREVHQGRQLMTIHPWANPPRSSSQWFGQDEWLDFNMWQTGHTLQVPNGLYVRSDYDRYPVKPVLDGEPGYENIHACLRRHRPKWTADDVRQAAYWAVFAGACGHSYGCCEVYQFYRPGGAADEWGAEIPWQVAVDLPGAAQMGYLRRLLESRPLLERLPEAIHDGGGVLDWRTVSMKAADGSYAFVYVNPVAEVHVWMDKIAHRVRAWWFDPRTGEAEVIGEFPNEGRRTFVPPERDGASDMVLVLDDVCREFGAPGFRGEKSHD